MVAAAWIFRTGCHRRDRDGLRRPRDFGCAVEALGAGSPQKPLHLTRMSHPASARGRAANAGPRRPFSEGWAAQMPGRPAGQGSSQWGRVARMRLLAVHPSGLMYTRVFLRLEPLGLELIASAARVAGHEVQIVDLQVETHA